MAKRVGIIGAGASGLMAACFAAENGNEVLLFEKQHKIGRKLQAAGNGRCNISNKSLSSNFASHYHGNNLRFAADVISHFGLEETEKFFADIGLPFIEKEDGRLFPASLQGSSVSAIFQYELAKRGVKLLLNRRVDSLIQSKEGFTVITAGKENHSFDSVILSAGSSAFPSLGGGDYGYRLAAFFRHRIIEPWPVILPINIPLKALHRLQGIKWDVCAKVKDGDEIIFESCGEILFTAYGISGPVSLMISREVNGMLRKKRHPIIEIDFFPKIEGSELENFFEILWNDKNKKFAFSLTGALKERMADFLSVAAAIDPEARLSSVGKNERAAFIKTAKSVKLEAGPPRGFKEAAAAAGGVATDEIDPRTMESLLVKNLFITGELLDVDGDSGGYNLQFAWSSGALAGLAQRA